MGGRIPGDTSMTALQMLKQIDDFCSKQTARLYNDGAVHTDELMSTWRTLRRKMFSRLFAAVVEKFGAIATSIALSHLGESPADYGLVPVKA